MTDRQRLTNSEAAAYAGKTPAAWKQARIRRPCPPDGHFGRTPYWFPATIDQWLSEAPYAGRRRHSPNQPTTEKGS